MLLKNLLRGGLLVLCLIPLATQAADEGGLSEGMVNPGYHEPPPWFKNSFLDLAEDLRETTAEGKRLLIYFYQDGCPYCAKLLAVNWQDPDIVAKTRDHFEVIQINIWGDRELTDFDGKTTTEKAFAEKLRVMYTPTLLFLQEDGQVALRANGYYPPEKLSAALDYVAEKKEGVLAFSEFFRDNSKNKANSQLHKETGYIQKPYRLTQQARQGNRPLLVIFEQRWCAHCDELHQDVFKRAETKQYLEKFDIVLLDLWSKERITTPDGKERSMLAWGKELGVNYTPSMVFFDPEGKEVFRTEAYLKSFHIQSVLDYVSSGAYVTQPNLQRFIQARADALRAQGVHVDLMQ